ncbi:MAG TPA: GTPase Era [Actinomycetota bacterium]|jgi:GTP-binding protein Era|nr:GTPase Era [Actinomycetota bacterium]HNL51164.1 GTPase Era [Actinomycetota bacterium]HNO15750.1 GTPase Era [Actinomycetota bacterium]HUM86514.1 GTPase Era [Actinomycetota bacterium]
MSRSGFAILIGRPNVGKSTLTNALVGQAVAITSSRPQTTRHTIRGVLNRGEDQVVLVDTPGIHRPRTLLGRRLNDLVLATLAEVDVVVLCLPADQRVGPGDRFIAERLRELRRQRLVVVITKADSVPREVVAERLMEADGFATEMGLEVAEFVPVSALDGANVDELAGVLAEMMPEGPRLFGDELTDQPERVVVAELIREAALERLRDELPHSVAVDIDEMGLREGRPEDDPLMDIYAVLYVERASQKPIVLGRRGELLKQIGKESRGKIEALLGNRVYLDLHVKVAKDWQNNPSQLRRLGF